MDSGIEEDLGYMDRFIINKYLMSLWFPSTCHKASGPFTAYFLRLTNVSCRLLTKSPGLEVAPQSASPLDPGFHHLLQSVPILS